MGIIIVWELQSPVANSGNFIRGNEKDEKMILDEYFFID
jgi:hypothetical protein